MQVDRRPAEVGRHGRPLLGRLLGGAVLRQAHHRRPLRRLEPHGGDGRAHAQRRHPCRAAVVNGDTRGHGVPDGPAHLAAGELQVGGVPGVEDDGPVVVQQIQVLFADGSPLRRHGAQVQLVARARGPRLAAPGLFERLVRIRQYGVVEPLVQRVPPDMEGGRQGVPLARSHRLVQHAQRECADGVVPVLTVGVPFLEPKAVRRVDRQQCAVHGAVAVVGDSRPYLGVRAGREVPLLRGLAEPEVRAVAQGDPGLRRNRRQLPGGGRVAHVPGRADVGARQCAQSEPGRRHAVGPHRHLGEVADRLEGRLGHAVRGPRHSRERGDLAGVHGQLAGRHPVLGVVVGDPDIEDTLRRRAVRVGPRQHGVGRHADPQLIGRGVHGPGPDRGQGTAGERGSEQSMLHELPLVDDRSVTRPAARGRGCTRRPGCGDVRPFSGTEAACPARCIAMQWTES